MKQQNKLWLSGNEALALGAYEAGVSVATSYPGTPATEILEQLATYDSIYTEWSTNEKVALEVAIGAAFAGARSLVSMKHVGLNVAADPFFTVSYTGVHGGLVIISADDPDMHSSQNEQDNRHYALAAKIPLLEPADPTEARHFMQLAFDISEQFDTPVLVRITTRIAHGKGLVEAGGKPQQRPVKGLEKMPDKFVMLPSISRQRRQIMLERDARLKDFAESFTENRMEIIEPKMGFITSGISYLYVKEAFPEASVLKLGMTFPIPETLVRDFARQVESIYIVEELDPFLEFQIKALGIGCQGKDILPSTGELSPRILRSSLDQSTHNAVFSPVPLPDRPPNMCPGCPHRGIFYNLSQMELFISGDIGCYTLAYQPPLSAIDSVVCMGAGLGIAHGMDKVLGRDAQGKIVAVIGDSTFIHSGITGLIDIVYNQGCSTVIILDNRVTAMTGLQPNPVSGVNLMGEKTPRINLFDLCKAIGIEHVYITDPHDIPANHALISCELKRPEPSVIISQAPCALLPEVRGKCNIAYTIDKNVCTCCESCLALSCPAIEKFDQFQTQSTDAGSCSPQINPLLCNGCGQCVYLCEFQAIVKRPETAAC